MSQKPFQAKRMMEVQFNSRVKAKQQSQNSSKPYSIHKLEQKVSTVEQNSTQLHIKQFFQSKNTKSQQKSISQEVSIKQTKKQQKNLHSYYKPSKINISNVTKNSTNRLGVKQSKLYSLLAQYAQSVAFQEQSEQSKQKSDGKNIVGKGNRILNIQNMNSQSKNNSTDGGNGAQGQGLKGSRQAKIFGNKPKPKSNQQKISPMTEQAQSDPQLKHRSPFIQGSASPRVCSDMLVKHLQIVEVFEIEDDSVIEVEDD